MRRPAAGQRSRCSCFWMSRWGVLLRTPVTRVLGGGGGGRVVRPPPSSGAGYLVMITGMERVPVTIWVAVRTCLVTAGLLPGLPRAGPMVMVAISWSLRG